VALVSAPFRNGPSAASETGPASNDGMTDRSLSEFEQALFSAVRELLLAGDSVRLKGLGTFSLTHVPARIEEISASESKPTPNSEYGRTLPPRDIVAFQDEHHITA